MDKIISSLIDKISSPLIIVGLLVLLGIVYILFKFFFKATKDAWVEKVKSFNVMNFFKKKEELKDGFKYTIQDLKQHKVFSKLKRLKEHEHKFYTHGVFDELKTKAFKIFLTAKMDSTIEHINKIIDEATNDLSELALRNLIDMRFEDCNDNLSCKMRQHFTDVNNPERIPDKTADKIIDKFLSVREAAMNMYEETFDDIFSTPTFENNFQLLNVVLFVVHIESKDMLDACIEAFESVNGDFMKIKNKE